MSDNATLVERMRQFHAEIVASDGAESGQMFMMGEAADRIAELEAQIKLVSQPEIPADAKPPDEKLIYTVEAVHAVFVDGVPHWQYCLKTVGVLADLARIAELEAENERLVEQVRQFTADLDDSTISVGEAYAYRSEDHGPGEKAMTSAYVSELEDRWLKGKARIAELEAENISIMATDKRLISENMRLVDASITANARIAELEAERDRLRFALDCIAAGETSDLAPIAVAAIRGRPAP